MGKCGKMWGDMGNVCTKFSDKFCHSIFSEDNLAFLAYHFEATTKSNCTRFTNCGCGEMWENVGEGEKVWRSLTKQTIWACLKSIISNRKLPFTAMYFEVIIKSISTRSTNCGPWRIWGNVAKCGRYGERFLKKLATNFVSQYPARIILPS